jgi:hypothetical protein
MQNQVSSTTVNDIVRKYWTEYQNKYRVVEHERRVIRHIMQCRTPDMGARVQECDNCDYTLTLFNSCRDRNCPLCQSMKKEQWILNRKSEVLPFQYFHVVFTLPDKLDPIVIRNKRKIYALLFDKVKETLLSAASERKYFGAAIGFFAVLHTWGQRLGIHPHLHCVVPGGGYDHVKRKWKRCRNNFFISFEVLANRFRSLFLSTLKEMYRNNELYLAGCEYDHPDLFQNLIDELWHTRWNVFLKETYESDTNVIDYLGRYTHGIAISNYRIVKLEDDFVYFTYKDYRDNNKRKMEKMHVLKFMRRFFFHIVPKRFVRIRYFGLLAHRNRSGSIRECMEYFKMKIAKRNREYTWIDIFTKVMGRDPLACPKCKTGRLAKKIAERVGGFRDSPGISEGV